MSQHYEERYYRDNGDYEEHRRSSSRRRSTSRGSRHRMPQTTEEHYYRQRLARSGSGSSISSISDYDYRAQCNPERPLVRVPRDVIRAPTPPPVVQRVVERAPTPEPDIVERVIVRPQPQQLIERIIERPRTPPPKIIDKEICEPAPPPIVRTRIVKVDHSARHYVNNNPSRYVCPPRAGLPNYGPVTDYDYLGYDRSYSNSYSTAEAYPQASAAGYTQYQATSAPQAYPSVVSVQQAQPQHHHQHQHQQVYHINPNPMPYQSQYGSAGPTQYGYRPVNSGAFVQSHQMNPQQPQMFQRQY